MFARKLGRLAGLVFVLVAMAGGTAATASSEHATGGSAIAAFQPLLGDIDWQ